MTMLHPDAAASPSPPSLLTKLSEGLGICSSGTSIASVPDSRLSLHAVYVSADDLAAAPFILAPNATLLAARAVCTVEATELLKGTLAARWRELPWKRELLRAPREDFPPALWWRFEAPMAEAEAAASAVGKEEPDGSDIAAVQGGAVEAVAEAVSEALTQGRGELLNATSFADELATAEATGCVPAAKVALRHVEGLKLDLSGLVAHLRRLRLEAEKGSALEDEVEESYLLEVKDEEAPLLEEEVDENHHLEILDSETAITKPAEPRQRAAVTPQLIAYEDTMSYAGVLLCVAREERVVSWVEQLSSSVSSGVSASSSGIERGKESLRMGWSASKRIGSSWCDISLEGVTPAPLSSAQASPVRPHSGSDQTGAQARSSHPNKSLSNCTPPFLPGGLPARASSIRHSNIF